nr:MAG TPA: hypothetical protein [Caudoviricetes sp.]
MAFAYGNKFISQHELAFSQFHTSFGRKKRTLGESRAD